MPNFPAMLMAECGEMPPVLNISEKLHDKLMHDYVQQDGGRTYTIQAHRNGMICEFVTTSQGIILMLTAMSDDSRTALGRWLEHCVYGGGANGVINRKVQLRPDDSVLMESELGRNHPLLKLKQQVIHVTRIDRGEHPNWKSTFIVTFVLSPAN